MLVNAFNNYLNCLYTVILKKKVKKVLFHVCLKEGPIVDKYGF
jgi:hypothetical protein